MHSPYKSSYRSQRQIFWGNMWTCIDYMYLHPTLKYLHKHLHSMLKIFLKLWNANCEKMVKYLHMHLHSMLKIFVEFWNANIVIKMVCIELLPKTKWKTKYSIKELEVVISTTFYHINKDDDDSTYPTRVMFEQKDVNSNKDDSSYSWDHIWWGCVTTREIRVQVGVRCDFEPSPQKERANYKFFDAFKGYWSLISSKEEEKDNQDKENERGIKRKNHRWNSVHRPRISAYLNQLLITLHIQPPTIIYNFQPWATQSNHQEFCWWRYTSTSQFSINFLMEIHPNINPFKFILLSTLKMKHNIRVSIA